MVESRKTDQGRTTFKVEENFGSTQKLSGLHFLNNRDLKGPQKDDSHTTKAGHINCLSEMETKYLSASLSTLLYRIPVSSIQLLLIYSHVDYFLNLLFCTLQIQYSILDNNEHFVMA